MLLGFTFSASRDAPVSPPCPTSLRLAAPRAELAAGFRALQSRQDLAVLLDVRPVDIKYYATRITSGRYRRFAVPKRRGGLRLLSEPAPGLKIIQQKLLQVLEAVFEPPDCAHGFIEGRSIATNAFPHESATEVLNVDLRDFFGAINFGRVWGLLRAAPYSLPHAPATLITQLVTHENRLPQGAPTSPIVSNMVARSLDRALVRVARRSRLTYTRYADDLTFSGRRVPRSWFDGDVGDRPDEVILGPALTTVVEAAGFEVNPEKTRLMRGPQRKRVTGLITNERVNVPRAFIRQLRARLSAWSRFGEQAAEEHWQDHRGRRGSGAPRFRDAVLGQLDFLKMVRGSDDLVYERYYRLYCDLAGASYVPPHDRAWNHLSRPDDAIWVVESSAGQGTAFFLDDFGLVTCEHVIGDDLVAFTPKRPDRRQSVRVLAKDWKVDLAILEVDTPIETSLRARWAVPRAGTRVHALGYPDYNRGSSIWLGKQSVSGTRSFAGVDRLTLAAPLIKGMSGGPLLDVHNRVVGVIATDPELYNSVIPIGQVIVLAAREGLI